MVTAYICDAIRTPIGRYGGALASVRTDDLAAIPIAALMARNRSVDWNALDDVIYGCANQAGEDNRNVARMALLLAGLPKEVPGSTVNRLCGSSLDAVATAVMLPHELEALSRQNPKLQFVVGQELTSLKRPYRIVEIYP